MGETTGIGWTSKTYNPWQGCRKVSAGCKNCYMFSEKIRYGQKPDVVVRSKDPTFNAPLKWAEPALVFTCSWSDFFIEEADEWREDAWKIIRATPHLTYQILTKRPERIDACLPGGWPYPNCWIGISAENQETLEARLPSLLETQATVRFLSLEPLLGPIDIWAAVRKAEEVAVEPRAWERGGTWLQWVIAGGESGAKARPMDVAWLRSIVEQCQSAGVACFVKQDSGPKPGTQGAIPDDLWLKEYPAPPSAQSAAASSIAPGRPTDETLAKSSTGG